MGQSQAGPRRARTKGSGGLTLGQATAVLGAGTLASRLTGFLRVVAVTYVLGVSPLSDAYNYANGVPNIVYELVLGGVLSATLIPVFIELFRTGQAPAGEDVAQGLPEEASRGASAILTAIGAVLVVVSAALWALAPYVIDFYLLLNHASGAPAERALATSLLRLFAPQVFFLGAIVVTTALLNARRHFAVPAFSPVLNNLVAIAALVATKLVASAILAPKVPATTALLRLRQDEQAVLILGLGTTAGYMAQFLLHLPAMRSAGLRLRPVWDLRHPAVAKVVRLSSWLLGVVLANQVGLNVVMVLAGRKQGGITAYQTAYQFFQLPYALFAVSLSTAMMPDLAERWSSGDTTGFKRRAIMGSRATLALLVPAGVGYALVATPFVQLAVHHGRTTAVGAHLVASTLALFALSLPGFSVYLLLMRVYQAMQDARAMFWIYAAENAITVVAAFALEPSLGVPGLALAWAGPYTLAALIAVADLRRRLGSLGGALTVWAIFRILLASAFMVLVVVLVGAALPGKGGDGALVGRLVAQVGAGTLAYLAAARAIGVNELKPVLELARLGGGARPARGSHRAR